MDIPYTVQPRPDTGVYNAKVGMWLFLASEVMLFGGLFSSYILLRVAAGPGTWPTGWLSVPLGTINTLILALSAVTTLLAWAACKAKMFDRYKLFMGLTLDARIVVLREKGSLGPFRLDCEEDLLHLGQSANPVPRRLLRLSTVPGSLGRLILRRCIDSDFGRMRQQQGERVVRVTLIPRAIPSGNAATTVARTRASPPHGPRRVTPNAESSGMASVVGILSAP